MLLAQMKRSLIVHGLSGFLVAKTGRNNLSGESLQYHNWAINKEASFLLILRVINETIILNPLLRESRDSIYTYTLTTT
jgi:hypothetical protein